MNPEPIQGNSLIVSAPALAAQYNQILTGAWNWLIADVLLETADGIDADDLDEHSTNLKVKGK
jgi:hypothetical protein